MYTYIEAYFAQKSGHFPLLQCGQCSTVCIDAIDNIDIIILNTFTTLFIQFIFLFLAAR